MNLDKYLHKAESFVRRWFAERVPVEYTYHTFEHTSKVVSQTIELCHAEGLSVERTFLLAMASWFHDTGFGLGLDDHESHSCTVFATFCEANSELIVFMDSINELIKATEYTRQPQNLDEKILRDADLHYLGTSDYETEANALRLEWAAVLGNSYTDKEWLQINADFLNNHHFHSSFASHKFEATKRKNLEEVQKALSLL